MSKQPIWKKLFGYFSVFEWTLYLTSVCVITLAFCLGEDFKWLTLISSLVGVSALIFLAKGNVIGQFLVILFAILYALVSYQQRYFGEMITYLGMSLPSAAVACVSWIRHPSNKGASEVSIAKMTEKKWLFCALFTLIITFVFYFILRYFHTNNLILSTVSVATSFFASMLTIFRSPYYALAYGANDLVLIGLWTCSCFVSLAYLPMVVCFVAFLSSDSYAFFNWKRLAKEQNRRKS